MKTAEVAGGTSVEREVETWKQTEGLQLEEDSSVLQLEEDSSVLANIHLESQIFC